MTRRGVHQDAGGLMGRRHKGGNDRKGVQYALLRFLQFLAVRRERGKPWVWSRKTRSCEGRIDHSGAAVQL